MNNCYKSYNIRIRKYIVQHIKDEYPFLKYKCNLKDFYITKDETDEWYVWKYEVDCGNDSLYNAYAFVRKVDGARFNEVFEYSRYYFDYDKILFSKIDKAYELNDYRAEGVVAGDIHRPMYVFCIKNLDDKNLICNKVFDIYKMVESESQGDYPINVIVNVEYDNKVALFYSSIFYGKYTDKRRKYTDDEVKDYICKKIDNICK